MEDCRCLVQENRTIGRYQLLREIGRGGMGTVFEAIHPELGSRVAIKMLQPTLGDQSKAHRRFIREARAAAQTRHLHAVGVYDIGSHQGLPYIVMELLEGETLAKLLAREAPLLPPRIAELLLPVLSAVMAAHNAGVVHRDLKPANIVLARRGGSICHPVVTDFGISKFVADVNPVITGSHAILGTIHYMAPELTRSSEAASPLSDLYSIGVIMYEAATGQRPFAGAGPYELMHAIVTGVFPPPRALRADIPLAMESMILRAMNRDPDGRFPSLRALGAALLGSASAKTWAIWAEEFEALSECPEATQSDPPESARVMSVTPDRFGTRTAGTLRSRLAIPSFVMLGLAIFAGGWIAAYATGNSHPRAADAVVSRTLPGLTAALASAPMAPALNDGINKSALTVASAGDVPAPTRTEPAAAKAIAPMAGGTTVRPLHHSEPAPSLETVRHPPNTSSGAAPRGGGTSEFSATERGSNDAPIIE